MSINLLDLAKGAIGNQVMGQLGGILGLDNNKTSSAVNAALPAILGGMMSKASTNEGAGELFKEMNNHDGGILDNLGGMISGDGGSGLLKMGTSLLPMLFGSRQSSLVGTVAKTLGLGDGIASKLLGMLAPIVMGVVGKQTRASNLDASGFASMLSDQKNHLAGAMPAGMGESLGLSSLLGSAGSAASSAGRAATSAASGAANSARDAVGSVAPKSGGGLGALLPIIGLGLLGLLAWMFWPKGGTDLVEGAKGAVGSATGAIGDGIEGATGAIGDGISGAAGAVGDGISGAAGAVGDGISGAAGAVGDGISGAAGALSGGMDGVRNAAGDGIEAAGGLASGLQLPGIGGVGTQLTESLGGLTESLGGITDVESAKAAAAKVTEASTAFDGLNLGAMPEAAQSTLGGVIAPIVEKINGALETAYAIPGVQGVLEPVITPFLEKLGGIGA